MSIVKRAGLSALAIALLAGITACSSEEEEVTLTSNQEKAVSERLKPAGEVTLESDVVATAPAIDANAGAEPRSGEEVYNAACVSCHQVGAAGAPRLADAAAWEPRIAKGTETLYSNAINGFMGMPPRGACMNCSDEEIKLAVDYMLESVQ